MNKEMHVINKKIRKIRGYIYAKMIKARHEKHFPGEVDLKYLRMGPAQGDTLVVVFSSCTRRGVAARYNYVKTLTDIKVPKLFILDDFGLDGRGGYYLGQDGGEEVYRSTLALIAKIKADTRASKVIYCGSSKGGWAALKFGVGDSCGTVIAGSPQYLLGNYAIDEYEKDGQSNLLLPYLSHDLHEEKRINWLNGLVRQEIEQQSSDASVYLCYSVKEHTYAEHIKFLIDDLRAAGRPVSASEKPFVNHSDISLYFPEYLHSTLVALGLANENICSDINV